MVSATVCLCTYETNCNLLCDEPQIPQNDGLATLGVFNKFWATSRNGLNSATGCKMSALSHLVQKSEMHGFQGPLLRIRRW